MSPNKYNLRSRNLNVRQNVRGLKRGVVEKPKISNAVSTKRKNSQTQAAPLDPRLNYDAKFLKHPEAVADFAPDIFEYMHRQESSYQVPNYLANNGVIYEKHRALIVDWLVECQESFFFVHETLYIAIRLLDLYLSRYPSTPVNQLQLVAASSFLIASKYEEYEAIRIKDLDDLCMKLYRKKDFLDMEREVLRSAKCDLGFPLSYSFLRRYARVIGTDMKTLTLARLYLELSVHYFKWVLESPSKVAAVVLVLALSKTSTQVGWAPVLEHYSGYSAADLDGPVRQMADSMAQFKTVFPKCGVVLAKYSDETFFEVASEFIA